MYRYDLLHPEERKTTLFGKVLAFFGVHEAQGRGSLHFHFLLWTDALFDQVIQHAVEKEEFNIHEADAKYVPSDGIHELFQRKME